MAEKIDSTAQIDLEEHAAIVIRYLKERRPEDIARDLISVRTQYEVNRITDALTGVSKHG